MNQQDAEDYCRKLGGHLPTTREFAQFMNLEAILELEHLSSELKGKVPPGYASDRHSHMRIIGTHK
jgi:hypothetical protein